MPSNCLMYEVSCPNCKTNRMVRYDVFYRLQKEGKPLICKPCNNRMRFEKRDHSRKGTGVKNNPELLRTRNSYYKAKQRCKMGEKHHACYSNVKFLFTSLQQLIDCIGVRPEGKTLDRIDPLGNYEPNNVRWATISEQAENRMPRNYWRNQNR
jgi:hypothetical protein